MHYKFEYIYINHRPIIMGAEWLPWQNHTCGLVGWALQRIRVQGVPGLIPEKVLGLIKYVIMMIFMTGFKFYKKIT